MRKVRLSKLASPRGLVGGPFGSSLVSNDYRETGVPVIRGANMGVGRFVGGDFAYVSMEKLENDLGRNTAVARDVVFTQRGTLGQVALVPRSEHEIYVVSQSQMRLRVDPGLASPEFVYYAATSADFLRQIDDRAISTGVPHTNLGILAELEIPALPLAEQQAIAEVLGALDDKIAANTRLAEIADELASSLLKAAQSDDWIALEDLSTITMGSSPKGEALNETDEGLPFYQGVRDFGMRFPQKRVSTTSPVRMANEGDVLVSVRAPVGEVNFANENLCIGRGLAAVRSTRGAQMTLFHQLRSAKEVWAPFEAEGTVFGSINRAQLHSLQVRRVHNFCAATLERQLSRLEAIVSAAIDENYTLASTRDALIPKLMSGRIRLGAFSGSDSNG